MAKKKSNKNPCSRETFPKLPGGTSFFLFEDAVKIGNIIETAVISHFRYRIRRFDQDAACMTEPDFRQAIDKGITRPLPEETAK